jgi:hypothetical protein
LIQKGIGLELGVDLPAVGAAAAGMRCAWRM